MANHSNQIQEQIQTQRQGFSQMQVAFVRLLELPTEGVEERVRTELIENPALEMLDAADSVTEKFDATDETDVSDTYMGEEEEEDAPQAYTNEVDEEDLAALGDYSTPDDIPDYALADYATHNDVAEREIPFTGSISFLESMHEQLAESPLKGQECEMAEYLIGSLDDDGLLRKPLNSIVEELAIYRGIYTTEPELQSVLTVIHSFEPVGVGARSLQECLVLQLQVKPHSEVKEAAMTILNRYYDDFSHKRWERIIDGMGISHTLFDQAIEELTRLNPRPGSAMSEAVDKGMQQIIPDFYIYVDDEENVTFTLNDGNVPDLRVSGSFERMIKEYSGQKETRESREALMFLRQKVEAARAFIDLVELRRQTLVSTMEAIVRMQHDYLVDGDESLMKPMLMKDVAEATGLDISTISRVSSSKYVETSFGIFPLKHFFGDSYRQPNFNRKKQLVEEDSDTTTEEQTTLRQIKAIIQQCVDNEDKKTPMTDEQLMEKLKEQGLNLARRTVAKYRQQLGIPVARMRR